MALFFPGMIAEKARKAGMKIPEEPDEDWDPKEFPHFAVFCTVQLGTPFHGWDDVAHNANIIAKVSDEEIVKITLADLQKLGIIYTG